MLVKMPEFKVTGSLEDLSEWYKSLGWNPKIHKLDPTKVGINSEDDKEIIQKFFDSVKNFDTAYLTFFWVNYGPSPRDDVPKGFILLEKGWVIPL